METCLKTCGFWFLGPSVFRACVDRCGVPIPRCVPMMQSSELLSRMQLRYDVPVTRMELLRRWCSAAPSSGSSAAVGTEEPQLTRDGWRSRSKSELQRYEVCLCCWLTTALDAQEARQLALAVLLLLVGQQLVDELPDELLGRSVQHGKHVHDQSVHVPSRQTRHATSRTLIDVEPYSSSSSCIFSLGN